MPSDGQSQAFDAVFRDMGEAGQCLVAMLACEGAAGNLSVHLPSREPLPQQFSVTEVVSLPLDVPELAHSHFVVSGSGTRMRDLRDKPHECLGILTVNHDGRTALLRTTPERAFARITSEFNSHLAVHRDAQTKAPNSYHAVVHAQPRHLTYLSHCPEYRDCDTLNRRLLRFQPEAILNFPEGIGIEPFFVPGQAELAEATASAMKKHRLVVWSKHGVLARSNKSVMAAVDLIEYAEAAASYELLDRSQGRHADGLSVEDMRAVCAAYGVEPSVF